MFLYFHFQSGPSTSDNAIRPSNVAGRSSPETVISLQLDAENNDDSQDTISNTEVSVNLIEGQFEFTEPNAVAGPSNSNVKTKTCKGKCLAKNSCNKHVPSAGLKKASQLMSTRGAALNVLDLDLVNNLMDDGNFSSLLN